MFTESDVLGQIGRRVLPAFDSAVVVSSTLISAFGTQRTQHAASIVSQEKAHKVLCDSTYCNTVSCAKTRQLVFPVSCNGSRSVPGERVVWISSVIPNCVHKSAFSFAMGVTWNSAHSHHHAFVVPSDNV